MPLPAFAATGPRLGFPPRISCGGKIRCNDAGFDEAGVNEARFDRVRFDKSKFIASAA